ncbi:PTS transporter subunit EIIC [Culicoidibacter larvae]|uniref:Permease IIC component n=1 Tax=Culicoidibacter larvae TaxID=2579976 RepID=A0A5R8QBA4_9FIRM|nr:PTS transporter subunit EIIC [Culicoidibacter larvae]TLG72939.1 PTS sugar transporter subunit IIC [Culicoidibacter larvae]
MVIQKIENLVLPISQYIQNNKALIAIKDMFIKLTPGLVIYSLLVILTPLLSELIPFYQEIIILISAGINIIACLGVVYYYSRSLDLEFLPAMLISGSAYLIFMYPNYMVNQLIIAVLLAILATKLFQGLQLIRKKLEVKLPNTVIPPGVWGTILDLLLYVLLLLLFFLLYKFLAQTLAWAPAFGLGVLQQSLYLVGNNIVVFILLEGFGQLLWFFGIHGNTVISMIADPLWYSLSLENLQLGMQGMEPVFIITKQFKEVFLQMGGSGSTLPLVLLLLTSRSKRLQQFGFGVLPAGLFNINEPVIFGLPIVLNPLLFIPWLIATPICALISYLVMYFGLVQLTSGVFIPWITPVFLSGWLVSGVSGIILQLVLVIVSVLIYLPFFKRFEKKTLLEETE